MARACRIAGDPKTATLYLTDALKTARDSGWTAGEIACLCEEAYTQGELDDPAAAETAAAAAHALALSAEDPALIAATYLAMGEVSRAAGDGGAAFDALVSCIETSSDIRVVGRDVPFLFFGDTQREAALSHLLFLAAEAGKEKRAFAAVAGYEGAKAAREALWGPPGPAEPGRGADAALSRCRGARYCGRGRIDRRRIRHVRRYLARRSRRGCWTRRAGPLTPPRRGLPASRRALPFGWGLTIPTPPNRRAVCPRTRRSSIT